MRVLITGGDGFIGRNLRVALSEMSRWQVDVVTRATAPCELEEALSTADAVVHLAGVNRPERVDEFMEGNATLTECLARALVSAGRRASVLFASSIHATSPGPYGESKLAAEHALEAYAAEADASVGIYRLPGVFGKWARPNYNSVVATFCHNIARGCPVEVHDPQASLRLVYIDDVIRELTLALDAPRPGLWRRQVLPEHVISVGELESRIRFFADGRAGLRVGRVGAGFDRALYSTFVSYLEPSAFSYPLVKHEDARGTFVEFLKTEDAGQVSFFTAHPGVTRGGHYHHTKTEKFLVVTGRARFRFRSLRTGEVVSFDTEGEAPTVVDTIPGWVHDITNIGDTEMLVVLWANEVFDRERPDTIASKVEP